MNMFENPSAGKFGPPPENAQRERELERLTAARGRSGSRKEWVVVVLSVAYLALKMASPARSGWIAVLVMLTGAALLAAQFFVGRQVRDEREGPAPYSPGTHITR